MPDPITARIRDAVSGPTYGLLLWLGTGWAIANSLYAYLILRGEQHRIESAVLILVAIAIPRIVFGQARAPTRLRLIRPEQIGFFLLTLTLWLVIFVPLLDFPFLSDDYGFLDSYRAPRDILRTTQFFRPVFSALFLALHRVGNGSSVPFHVVGLLLHLGAAGLVYSLVRRLLDSSDAAIVAFIVFLLNPLQLEASLWVSGLQELLWTVFLLAALSCYVGARILSNRRLIATMSLVLCAVLSKETAVCFVLLLPGANWAFFRMNRGRSLAGVYAAFAALLLLYLVLH
jgi:hypothetical protein